MTTVHVIFLSHNARALLPSSPSASCFCVLIKFAISIFAWSTFSLASRKNDKAILPFILLSLLACLRSMSSVNASGGSGANVMSGQVFCSLKHTEKFFKLFKAEQLWKILFSWSHGGEFVFIYRCAASDKTISTRFEMLRSPGRLRFPQQPWHLSQTLPRLSSSFRLPLWW